MQKMSESKEMAAEGYNAFTFKMDRYWEEAVELGMDIKQAKASLKLMLQREQWLMSELEILELARDDLAAGVFSSPKQAYEAHVLIALHDDASREFVVDEEDEINSNA